MDNSEFMDYIVQPLTFEQMNLLYKANDIKYDSVVFIMTLSNH